MNDQDAYQRQKDPAYNPPLTGQQVSSVAKYYNDEMVRIRKDIELRKLALDQACNVIASTNAARTDGQITFHNPIALARDMHAFLVEAAVEKTP